MLGLGRFKAGDYVQVRSADEILATLDDNGRLDGLPFMPEMLRHCGQTFKVDSVAHKTCDTIAKTGGRRMQRTVHIGSTRCDGTSHGGCQAACLLFWKEAWLKPHDGTEAPAETRGPPRCTEAMLEHATRKSPAGDVDERYSCQATELLEATEPLPWWDVRQYVADVRSRNATLRRLIAVSWIALYQRVVEIGLGYRFLVGLYDRVSRATGGSGYPFRRGRRAAGSEQPPEDLNLAPGDRVRVKSHEEILASLDANNKNRGLWFDAEMVPYCGGEYRVISRVQKIIDESSGRMLHMKAPCIILDNVFCRSIYSEKRRLCPRAIYSYWRESWLQRVSDTGTPNPPGE